MENGVFLGDMYSPKRELAFFGLKNAIANQESDLVELFESDMKYIYSRLDPDGIHKPSNIRNDILMAKLLGYLKSGRIKLFNLPSNRSILRLEDVDKDNSLIFAMVSTRDNELILKVFEINRFLTIKYIIQLGDVEFLKQLSSIGVDINLLSDSEFMTIISSIGKSSTSMISYVIELIKGNPQLRNSFTRIFDSSIIYNSFENLHLLVELYTSLYFPGTTGKYNEIFVVNGANRAGSCLKKGHLKMTRFLIEYMDRKQIRRFITEFQDDENYKFVVSDIRKKLLELQN
jgi:hypothetical protein